MASVVVVEEAMAAAEAMVEETRVTMKGQPRAATAGGMRKIYLCTHVTELHGKHAAGRLKYKRYTSHISQAVLGDGGAEG